MSYLFGFAPSAVLRLAADHAAAARVADEQAISHLNFAAHGDVQGSAFDGETLKSVVVVVGVLGSNRNRAAIVRVIDNKVRVGTDGDISLAREQTEELGRACAERIDKAMNVECTAFHTIGVHQIYPIFDAGNAVRDLGEGTGTEKLLLEVEGAMICANRVNQASLKRGPEAGLVAFFAKWRRHHVLHAFNSGPFGVTLVEEEVGKHGFDVNLDATEPGFHCGAQGRRTGKMDHVPRRSGLLKEGREAAGAFCFHGFRATGLMPFGAGFAFGEQQLLQLADQFGIFTMSSGNDAELGCQLQGVEHLFIIDAKKILISEEYLEGCRAVSDNFAQLRFSLRIKTSDGHVKCVVARAVAFSFLLPEVVALKCVFIAGRATHLNECRRSAKERGLAGRPMGVFGEGGHKGEMNVYVRIDEAREDKFASSIDHVGSGGCQELLADAADGFMLDEDVGVKPGIRDYDLSAFDQNCH